MRLHAPRLNSDRVWLFDLDNTLHNANPQIFPHINRAMTDYLKVHLALNEQDADALRVHYWRRYGATLLGLVRHHGVDPRHFLWHTHQFHNLSGMVRSEPGLGKTLTRLPGRKILFSNAPEHYSRRILDILGIASRFEAIFCIEHLKFLPKPDPGGFYRLLARSGLRATQCVMVEDSLENLKTAKKLGMKTVWLSAASQRPAYVDLTVRSIAELARRARRP